VTGSTAEDGDFTHQIKHGIPYVIACVLALAVLLLLVTFRSIIVPLKAIALNLLSVAAAYGVLVLVFQHRWAEGLLGSIRTARSSRGCRSSSSSSSSDSRWTTTCSSSAVYGKRSTAA
jgi:uncharacterized membrane protein YdfJ with MMPL/SSD domain